MTPVEYHQNIVKLPSDEMYLRNFIVHVDCSYLYGYYGPNNIMENKMNNLVKRNRINPITEGLRVQKKVEINDVSLSKKTILFELIKSLNNDKHGVLCYLEVEEFIQRMTKP